MNIKEMYANWLDCPLLPKDLKDELISVKDDDSAIEELFYQNLEFGTGGLRGKMGPGTNRMNLFTVAKATRGLAKHLKSESQSPSCALCYDSRINSEYFARLSAATLASEGIKVYLFPRLNPTPLLSFAVRYLACDGGIMITASHNPKVYNGYKVYDSEGCQISGETADKISELIAEESDLVESLPSFDKYLEKGDIVIIDEALFKAFDREIRALSVFTPKTPIKIAYSPLNGTGLKPVMRALNALENVEVAVVEEQEKPDGNFPTCPSPNPETKEAMQKVSELAIKLKADICLATDPDSDRVGVGVRKGEEVVLLSGNQVGVLLFDFIVSAKKELGTLPEKPVLVKTIVSTKLADKIASANGVETRNVLTGFKYIGEQIAELEKAGRPKSYIFGFEESCGYLSGAHVRDKDAVNACLLIAEMTSYYKGKGKSLLDAYDDISKKYGYFENSQLNFHFEGQSGQKIMAGLMQSFRKLDKNGEIPFLSMTDYLNDDTGLPSSDVLSFELSGERQFIVRPSGTEPKVKIYLSACGKTKQEAEKAVEELGKQCTELVHKLTK